MSKILYTSQENYIKSFRNEIDELIIEMEEFAKKGKVPILTPDSAQFLEQLITIHKPKRVLEIGCAIAYSTIRIAKNLKKKSVIDTIEVSKENIKKAKFYIDENGNRIELDQSIDQVVIHK